MAEHGGKISDGPEIGVNGAAFTLDGGLLDLQVGEGLRLDRELVGKTVALGLLSFVVRGAELGAALIVILFSKTIGTTRRPPLDCC